jgi:hypothetical protein
MQMAAVVALLLAPVALADGDPASDVLPAQAVFLPYPAPSAAVAAPLRRLVASANTGGNRVKVAVIGSRRDLGSVPVLFGKPTAYARFLGLELGQLYAGVLVIVMPAGVGVYDGGRSTAPQTRALAGLVPAKGANGLARTATTAVERLLAAHALRYVDVLPPIVVALPEHGRRGGTVKLEYAVVDDSGSAAISVRAGSQTIRVPLRAVNPSALYSVRWSVPSTAAAKVRYCVTARDARGNTSTPACAVVRVAR